jgi:hypothetical protein
MMIEKQEGVRFNGESVGFFGLFSSLCIAVGLPALILLFGRELGVAIQTILIILSLIFGSAVGIVLGFFAIVIPSSVGGSVTQRPRIKIQKNGENKVVEIDPTPCEEKPESERTSEPE